MAKKAAEKAEPKERTAGNSRPKKSYTDFGAILDKTKHRMIPPEITNHLPTGITLLDAMLGNGFPGGRFAMVHGEENTFKSAWSYHQAAIVQQMGGAVWLDDKEDKFNAENATINGLDYKHPHFYYTQTKTAEEYLAKLQDWLNLARTQSTPGLHIYDSLGAISTKQQQETTTEHPMSIAKKMASWLSTADLSGLSNTMAFPLWLNQQRAGIDFFSYGPPKPGLPGGKAAKYKVATRIKMSVQALSQKDKDKSVASPIGKLVKFTLEKSCTSPDSRWCFVPYFYHFGFDDGLSCLNYLIGMNYIKKGTQKATKEDPGNYGKYGIEGVWHTKSEWRSIFYDDPGARREIRAMTRQAYIADNSYRGGECDGDGDEEE